MAKDLTFQVYIMPLREQDYAGNNEKVRKLFSHTLIHNLDPDSTATLGVMQNFYNLTTSLGQSIDLSRLSIVGLTQFALFGHSRGCGNPVCSHFLGPWIPLFRGMTPIA